MTRRRVSSETLAPGVMVRETAERETPASSATCFALAKALRVLVESMGRVKSEHGKAVILHRRDRTDKVMMGSRIVSSRSVRLDAPVTPAC
jgi:hypothetical protein